MKILCKSPAGHVIVELKNLKWFGQSKRYNILMPYSLDNIHPLIIHFPIALLSTGLFFDLLAVILSREDLKNAGFWCMLLGVISCLFSNFTGLMIFLTGASFSDLPRFIHALLAWASTFIFTLLVWVRIKLDVDFRYSI